MIFGLFSNQEPITWYERGKVLLSFYYNNLFYKLEDFLRGEKLSITDKRALSSAYTTAAAIIARVQARQEYQNRTTTFPTGFIWEEFERGLSSILTAHGGVLAEHEELRSILESPEMVAEFNAMHPSEKSIELISGILDRILSSYWRMRTLANARSMEDKLAVASGESSVDDPMGFLINSSIFNNMATSLRIAIFASDAEARGWLKRLPPDLQNI